MAAGLYRYEFAPTISGDEIEGTLQLAVLAAESLHGAARVRLDAAYAYDPETRSVAIDARTPIGRALNRLFAGFLAREFGPDALVVERVPADRPATLMT
jgi:hypothetical protein